jgi:hypothetical protein
VHINSRFKKQAFQNTHADFSEESKEFNDSIEESKQYIKGNIEELTRNEIVVNR